VIVVYTPNYFDKNNVFRVRGLLREQCGIDGCYIINPIFIVGKGFTQIPPKRGAARCKLLLQINDNCGYRYTFPPDVI
jgi:hypothetical protein